jgi:hypothetical protein
MMTPPEMHEMIIWQLIIKNAAIKSDVSLHQFGMKYYWIHILHYYYIIISNSSSGGNPLWVNVTHIADDKILQS